MQRIKKQQGGALLTALFIMTLVAIVATAMSSRLQLDIYRTQLVLNHDKLYLASQAVSFWALSELEKDTLYTKANKQGMIKTFPKKMEGLVNQVKLAGGIYDLQARFNLNNVADKTYINAFNNLLKSFGSQIKAAERDNLLLALRDWLSTYDLSRGKDGYTTYYLSQKPPYHPAHQIMTSASELRLIKDVSPALCLALSSIITVLPETTPININTAPERVLMALGNGIKKEQINELLEARGDKGIKDLKEINELITKIDLPTQQITIESTYFLSIAYASKDNINLVVYTLLKRSRDKNKKLSVRVIRESINTF